MINNIQFSSSCSHIYMAEYMHRYEWEPKNISRPPLSRLVLLLKMNTIKNVRTMKPKLLPPSPSLLPVDQNRSLLLSLLAWVPCFIPKCIHVPLVKNIPHLFGEHLWLLGSNIPDNSGQMEGRRGTAAQKVKLQKKLGSKPLPVWIVFIKNIFTYNVPLGIWVSTESY